MNIFKNISLTFSALLIGGASFAQPMIDDQAQTETNSGTFEAVNRNWAPSLVNDGVIDREEHVNRVLDWAPIRENDVAWKRRVWREIDVRQKQNQAFVFVGDEYSGGGAFVEILLDAVRRGKVAAYNVIDDRFTTPLDMEDFESIVGGEEEEIFTEDPITGEMVSRITRTEFNINAVTKYQIKEDWIFDRNIGRMVVRIIGIAPLMDEMNETTGEYEYTYPLFWLYYPELRRELVNYEVYNPHNDMHRMSWTDYLDGRYFSSYIIKTNANNPRGIRLQDGLRGLYQGKELEEQIFEREMDMWEQ